MKPLTRLQREALKRVYDRPINGRSYGTDFCEGCHINKPADQLSADGLRCADCDPGGIEREGAYKLTRRSYRAFRRTVATPSYDDCVMVPWCGMWLGIERDGYTHS